MKTTSPSFCMERFTTAILVFFVEELMKIYLKPECQILLDI